VRDELDSLHDLRKKKEENVCLFAMSGSVFQFSGNTGKSLFACRVASSCEEKKERK
jgi:hypothetical protein